MCPYCRRDQKVCDADPCSTELQRRAQAYQFRKNLQLSMVKRELEIEELRKNLAAANDVIRMLNDELETFITANDLLKRTCEEYKTILRNCRVGYYNSNKEFDDDVTRVTAKAGVGG